MGKMSNLEKSHFLNCLFLLLVELRISLTGVHPDMKLGRDIQFGDVQGIGILKFV